MKNFAYAAPRTEGQAIEMLASAPGRAEVIAGGTDLVGLMKKMAVTPDLVVNVMEIPTLQEIGPDDHGAFRIGAAVRLEEALGHPYLEDYPALRQAIEAIGSMQLVAQGTIGGDVCCRPRCWYFRSGRGLLGEEGALAALGDNRHHAILGNSGPAKFVSGSRLAPALIALGASVRVIGPQESEEKLVPLADFYRTPRREDQRETMLLPGQLISHVVLPAADGRQSGAYDIKQSEGPDYPLASAAAMLRLEGGLVREARIVMGQVAPTPWVSDEAARILLGRAVSEATAEQAGQASVARATPLSENAYKVQLAKTAVKRAILRAAGLPTGGFE